MTGWWFGTWLLFSTSYMGCHPKPIDEVHHVSRLFFNHQPVKNCPIVCWLLRQFTTKHGQMMDGLLLWDYFSGSMGSVTCQNQSPRLRTQATCPCCMKYPQYTIGYIWIYIYTWIVTWICPLSTMVNHISSSCFTCLSSGTTIRQ